MQCNKEYTALSMYCSCNILTLIMRKQANKFRMWNRQCTRQLAWALFKTQCHEKQNPRDGLFYVKTD